MTTVHPTRIPYDIVGVQPSGQAIGFTKDIGSAVSFTTSAGLATKTNFLLVLRQQPCHFRRCFLVPRNGVVLPDTMLSTYRVCESSQRPDGNEFSYGIGTLTPTRGQLSTTSSYFELAPDMGGVLWRYGRFVALLDPRASDDFFTLSDAA